MAKWIVLFLLSIFSYDIALDSFESQCHDQGSACHACVCQTHLTHPLASSVQVIQSANPKFVISENSKISEQLFDKSLFHPPKALS